jgi:hypothetical protein
MPAVRCPIALHVLPTPGFNHSRVRAPCPFSEERVISFFFNESVLILDRPHFSVQIKAEV